MFNSFKKAPWITEDAIKAIIGLPKQYIVMVDYKTHSECIRNEAGDLLVDLVSCKNVTGFTVKYQEDGAENVFPVFDQLNNPYTVERFQKWIDGIVASHRQTSSNAPMEQLYEMQRKLRDTIQNTILIKGYQPEESKDIDIYPNSLSAEGRKRFAKLIMNLDRNSVDVMVTIRIKGSTMEQIDSTLNELAMYEALN